MILQRKRPSRDFAILFGLTIGFVGVPTAAAATYYVDFDEGSDSHDGLSETSAFQRAPGDPKAAGNAAATLLEPGDVVLFKGGVHYRGQVRLDADGALGNAITFKGDGWGSERAIIDGSERWTPTWIPCPSQAACGGNPHWASIYYAAAPADYTFFTTIFEDDEFLWFSQDPNPEDFFYYNRIDDYYVVPFGDPAISMTTTSVTDPSVLTQPDAGYWDGSFMVAWRYPNSIDIKSVTGFDPTTHTLSFEELDGDLYSDRDGYYSLLNHVGIIDTLGEYAYDASADRIYLWPRSSGDPASHSYTVAVRRYGIDIYGHHHVVIEGFQIQKHFGDFVEWNLGTAIRQVRSGDPATDIVIRNNVITKHRTMEGSGAIRFYNVANVLVEDNELHDNQRNAGVLAGGNNVVIRNNTISRCTRTGIYVLGVNHGQIIGNRVYDIRGTHNNAIAVYLDSVDILVANNWVTNAPSPFTVQNSANVTVINNVFDGTNGDNNVNEWSGDTRGTIIFFNNVMVRNARNFALNTSKSDNATYIVRNNFIDGFCPNPENTIWSHNIYTGLAWCQDPERDFGPGDFLEEDLSVLFVDPDAPNWHPLEDSPAIDSGVDVLSELPVSVFPEFDFSLDFEGISRPQYDGWDRGAYEDHPAGLGGGGAGGSTGAGGQNDGGAAGAVGPGPNQYGDAGEGCGCRTARRSSHGVASALFGLVLVAAWRRRMRHLKPGRWEWLARRQIWCAVGSCYGVQRLRTTLPCRHLVTRKVRRCRYRHPHRSQIHSELSQRWLRQRAG